MSRRQDIQSGEGVALDYRGYGVVEKVDKVAPTNGAVGYAPGCTWFNLAGTQTTGFKWTNIGGNGFGSNAGAVWVQDDPSSGQNIQLGASTALMKASGNLYANVYATGQSPAATGADKIIDVYTLPANVFDGVGFRNLTIQAGGNKAANGNTITAKIIIGATAPAIGATVSGGTVIGTVTGATNAAIGWNITSEVWYAAAGNVVYQETATVLGTTHGGDGVCAELALTLTGAIPICITINSATTATDCSLWWWNVQGYN